ncbi:MAG: tetratricopeptide repeat protein [Lachnospiraceae bacterium]|nr:tetratricopeptide repeat protein [Lachnospiraceae bacterium]MBO4762492.1 tetratricopeptide repeat protein [Lachnospiraceae bacterium]
MNKKSKAVGIMMLLLFFSLFLTGCVTEGSFDKAAKLYESGDYKAAEEQFELAIEKDPDNVDLRVGHGFNLAMLGRSREAIDELNPIYESKFLDGFVSESDIDFVCDLGDVLVDLYMEEGEPVNAALISDELIYLAHTADEKEKYRLKSAKVYVNLYKDNIEFEDVYRRALSDIIDLSVYAGNEYVALVNSYRSSGDYKGMLAAADNMIIYMRGRSAHIDNFPSAIGVILDTAEAATYAGSDRTPEDYYDAAQEFITLAGDKGLTYEQKLRYKIVIAERMRQTDVAIRLLGVYLNHCKDDRKAIKEKAFLENRF